MIKPKFQRGFAGKPVLINTPNGNAVMRGSGKLKGQAKFADQITLEQTVAALAGTNGFVFNDACGLNTSFGQNTFTASVEFDLSGSATANNFREWLKSFVGIVEWINYNSDIDGVADQAQLARNLRFATVSLLGDVQTYIVAVKANQRNTQFQRDMQTVYPNGEWAWTNNTSLGVVTSAPAAGTRTVTVTFKFSKWLSYSEYIPMSGSQLTEGQ